MEQFRAFLEVLKKYHFWVLCGLILLLSFGSWFWAASSEDKLFGTRKGQLESKLGVLKQISGNLEHPSEEYINKILNVTGGSLADQVAGASSRLYDEQHHANPLPKLYPDNETQQKDFEKAFEAIWGPMEEIEKLPPGQLDHVYREAYSNHIAAHFPKLFDLIERRTEVANGDDPAAADPRHQRPGAIRPRDGVGANLAGAARKLTGIVDWVDADEKIKKFLERFSGGIPSTLDIMLAQEDLWVYETLLKVVRNTNDVNPDPKHDPTKYQKPSSHKAAAIKQILAMDIGKDAVESWRKSENPIFTLAGEAGGALTADTRGQGAQPAQGAQTSSGRPGSASAANSGVSPLADRYVDDTGKPIKDPTQQPYPEFRMMPIDLKVVIEQKDIPRLLAECANSAMRIDVRNVRILVDQPPPVTLTESGGTSGSTNTGGTVNPRDRDMGSRRGLGGGVEHIMGRGRTGDKDESYAEESADPIYRPVPVEVQGIIYIYNPPPRVSKPAETAGGSGGPAASTPPNTATPLAPSGVTPAAPPAKSNPVPDAGPTAPAGTPTNPSTNTPVPGGRR